MQRLKFGLLAVAMIAALAACGTSGASPSNANVTKNNRQCDVVQQDLDDAQAEATDQAGTPDEADAAQAVEDLEAELETCDNGSDSTTTTTEDTGDTTTTTQPETSGDVVVEVDPDSLAGVFEGPVAPDELAFGADAEEAMVGAPEERGAAAHSRETLRTPQELTAWLNDGSDPNAQLTHDRVALAIGARCGAEDVAVHLEDSQGWLLMVVRPGSQILGTSYVVNGNMEFADGWRQVGENDAYWLPVCTTGPHMGEVVPDGIVRADCGNGSDTPKIRINRPNTPPTISVVCPPWIPGVNPPPGCPKTAQSFDDMQNGGRPVHGGGQGPQGNNGVYTGPTLDGNGDPISEPPAADPWNPPAGGGTTTPPDPTPGGHGGTGTGGTTPGGSTCTGGSCQGGGGGGPTGPVVTIAPDDGDHNTDPGGF
jgi:hypothetical protein